MTEILRADCVSKSFGERRVLTSATLRAESGQVRALFGRNGSGKTTLLRIAAGWMSPDQGAVHFSGRVLDAADPTRYASDGLFFLPARDLLSTAFTVRQQLQMLRQQFGGDDVRAAAERVGILDHIDQRPQRLSGGERRRAELAAVLVRRPRCLLADEPFRGVTPADAEELTRLFVSIARAGAAVVVTGHEVSTLMDAADHVTWCTSGTTYELGPPEAARRHDAFRREYLAS